MFQTQLFKKSFITTSLLIIQRRMNDKIFLRASKSREGRDGQHQSGLGATQPPGAATTAPASAVIKRPERRDNFRRREPKPVLNTLEGLFAQV